MRKLFLAISAIALSLSLVAGSAICQQVNVGSTTTITCTLADTEYSLSLGQGIKAFTVQCRTAQDLKLGFASGVVAGSTYYTVKSGTVYYSPIINSAVTIYLSSANPGAVAEIDYWK